MIPTQPPGLGAGVGVDDHYTIEQQNDLRYEDYQSHIDQNATKTQNASWKHDFAYSKMRDGNVVGPFRHAQWAIDAWTGPGVEPGFFGQVYRAIGTFAFPMFSVAESAIKIGS